MDNTTPPDASGARDAKGPCFTDACRGGGAHECPRWLMTCAGIEPRTATRWPGTSIRSAPSNTSSTARPSSAAAVGSMRCSTRSTARTCCGQRGPRSPATAALPALTASPSGPSSRRGSAASSTSCTLSWSRGATARCRSAGSRSQNALAGSAISAFLACVIGSSRRPGSWSWSRSSRRTSPTSPSGFGPGAAPTRRASVSVGTAAGTAVGGRGRHHGLLGSGITLPPGCCGGRRTVQRWPVGPRYAGPFAGQTAHGQRGARRA